MIIQQLDNEIFIYRKPTSEFFTNSLDALADVFIDKNIWEISSKTNILDTDMTINKKCLYLKDSYFDKKDADNKINLDNQYNKIIYFQLFFVN